MGFRLVRGAQHDELEMPIAPQKSSLIMREAIIALLIGIIPSSHGHISMRAANTLHLVG